MNSSSLQEFYQILYKWLDHFLENLEQSQTTSQYYMISIWWNQNITEWSQNLSRLFIYHSFKTTSRQIQYDNFQEMNCSHSKDKISEKSQKSWNLFRSYRMIITIYFLLCSTYWIFTTKKIILLQNDFIKEKSRKKYLKKIQIADSSILEYEIFEIIQKIFNKFNFLHH